jgi:hypothetical protein
MIVITELTANLPGNPSGRAGLKEGADVAVESDHCGRNRATERKGDTPLGYLGRIALRRDQCGVFTPCKNCNIETHSRNYAIVEESSLFCAMRVTL